MQEGRYHQIFDDQALLTAMEENENLITRILAEDFNMDHSLSQKAWKNIEIGWIDPP